MNPNNKLQNGFEGHSRPLDSRLLNVVDFTYTEQSECQIKGVSPKC